MKYSPDFYLLFTIMLIPTFGFVYATINKRSNPWVVKAIEDSDERPHHIDLTFLATFAFGWMVTICVEYGMCLYLVEEKNTLEFCGSGIIVVGGLWGLNKFFAHKEANKH